MAEILDISHRREDVKAYGDYEHNCHANNCCMNEMTESNKWNDIPRSKQDHTPKPVRQSFNDELHELSGIPHKGPVHNWEKAVKDKTGPWYENCFNRKQRDEYLVEGKCFHCGKMEHMSCHCPDGNTVASGSKSSPPGHHKPPLMSLASI